MKLYPYQEEGAAFLRTRRRAALFDEMRLGKTAMVLAALPEEPRCIIVCPAIAKSVWEFEAATWRPELVVTILSGLRSFRWPRQGEMIVLNYELLPENLDVTRLMFPPDAAFVLVADEAHYLKTARTQRTQRFRRLQAFIDSYGGRTWILTGTPLLREPPDLWHVLRAAGLDGQAFGDWWSFRRAFNAKEREIWIKGGKRRRITEWGEPVPAVKQAVARVALRRRRQDVLAWLPAKARRRLRVECLNPEARQLCDEALEALEASGLPLLEALERAMDSGGLALENLAKTRRALSILKVAAAGELLDDLAAAGRPTVLFSAHRAPIEALLASRPRWGAIMGGTPEWERQAAIQGFQKGRLDGVACTIGAAGTGISLTAASDVVFVDQDWTPMLNLQAEDRVCGPGQQGGVLVTVLEADHKLDLMLAAICRRKMQMAEASIG